ncbi:uncharacterized protein LOC129988064 isoform X2 [Argiope bruennichi]|uniref:uncharacterized protein LOC129988064 isoform X2 n=1 Tax=Argiope bruennichi TaxID=94029 RepID=UPI002494C2AD|nr:uncharacterized protein LOC129988064 isoform X2 [Argiope bruennichi]
MNRLKIFFFIAIFFPASLRAAICPSSDHESLLQPGYDYSYRFLGEAAVHTPDGERDRICLQCDITIFHVDACQFGLQIDSCFLRKNSHAEDETLDSLSKYPILFSLVNGEITDIYKNEEEPLDALNIKRGILSAFIFKISYTHHASQTIITDIHGTCPLATMPLEATKGSLKTTKNLRMCNRKGKEEQFMFFSNEKGVDSTIDCDYDIDLDERRLNQVNCTEKYSGGTIHSNIYYHVAYKSSRQQKVKTDFPSTTRRAGIQFEQQSHSNPEDFERVAQLMLSQLVEHTSDGIDLSTISEFRSLVTWLKSVSNLTTLLTEIQQTNHLSDGIDTLFSKKTFLAYLADALAQCNTVPCIEAISHLIKSGEFSPPDYLYYSWSKIQSPEPPFLKHIKNICYDTNSRLCWLMFGSFIQKMYLKQQNFDESTEQLFEALKCLKESTKSLCASADSDFEFLRRNLEIIKNVGDVYTLRSFESYKVLIGCFLKSYIPDDIKTLILEVLKTINPYHDETSEKEINEEFSHILLNSTLATNLRIIAYDQIILAPQDKEFGKILLTLLKADENIQLKSHIAKSLKTLFSTTNLKSSEKGFVTIMQELLEKEELSLNRMIHATEADSTTTSNFVSTEFILQELSNIGYKILNSKDSSIFIQVVCKLGQIFGFEDEISMKILSTLLQEVAQDIQAQFQSPDGLFKIVQELLEQFRMHSKSSQEYNYSEIILNNIRKLEKMYRKYKLESKSFFTSISDFIGNIWHYFSSGEIFQLPTRILEMHALLRDLEKGVYYNTTRIFRILEAHQQVPTMMGPVLKWDTSVDLAFSLRSGLKLEMQPENFAFILDAFLYPRAALTYLNGMVINLPFGAQIGVQTNKSAFVSSEWNAKLYYNEEKQILNFGKPSRSKNVLQFFDMHRIIKHGDWHDGENERKEIAPNCSDGLLSSLLGIQFCVMQSQSDLPKSNYRTWQIFLQPSDKKIESYNLEFMRPQEMKPHETIVKYSTVGSTNRREIFFIIGNDKLKSEVKFQLKIPSLPQFNLYLRSLKGIRNDKTVMNLTLFESYYYELIYEANYNLLKNHTDANKMSMDSKVQERLLSFRSPFNKYSVTLMDYGKKRSESTKVLLTYNSFNLDSRWLYEILPESFWETNTTAWLQIYIFWNREMNENSQQQICIIEDPHSVTHLSTGFLRFNGGERKYICVSKRQTFDGKLLAASQFTYGIWKQSDALNEVQTQIFNLTIAPKSWAVGVFKERKGSKFSYEVALSRNTRSSEIVEICDDITSWSGGYRSIYSADQPELKFAVDASMHIVSSQELAEKYSVVKEQELVGLWNQIIEANISFHYPFVSGQESIKAEGFVITSGGPTTTRFQTNSMIKSSYHNLQLASHSVYRSEEDFTSLHYNSNLTHFTTNEKIFHEVHFSISTPAGKCSEAEFRHTFLSRVFDLSTIVTYRCKPNHIDLHDLRLNMRTNSSHWSMLNLSISQLVEDQTPEYTFETCNVTHPLLLINVTADWVGKVRDHKKRALFTCREENSRSTELLIQALHNGKMSADLIIPANHMIPDSKRQKLSLQRTISSDAKTQNCKIVFSNDKTSDSEGLYLKGEILSKNYQIWNLKLHLETCAQIYTFLGKGYQNVLHRAVAIAKDSHHPVNKIFHSNFGTTLYEYFKDLYSQGNGILIVTWKNFEEIIANLKPVYEAPFNLLLNVLTTWKTYLTANDDSIIMVVMNYLKFSYVYNIRENIYEFLKPREKILEWEFLTNGIIQLESFNQWPSISHKEICIDPLNIEKSIQSQQSSTEVKKIALIINSSHVFRFDEHLYPSVLAPSDCAFLLAKDIRQSAFTVLSAQERVHVLFSEITISINKENIVFINDSRVPSTLPVHTSSGNVHVKKDGTSVEIQSPSLTINCIVQQKSHLCLLKLDFHQYLDTFGLLGGDYGFNSKEFSMPERKTSPSILEFVSKYEISGKAECKNLNQKIEFPTSSGNAKFCTRVLLQLCHLNWNILQQFVDMCKLGFKEDAISGYSALCIYGNFLNSTSPKGNVQHFESQEIEIVLVVQEHHSLKILGSTLEDIEQLMLTLNNQFAANGFSNVLFSLVGFGGRNSRDQSIFHIKQRAWPNVRDALKRFEFDGEGDIDISNVLRSILQTMDCDLFHSKLFLLLTTKETLNKNKDSVSDVKQLLKKSGDLLYAFFPRASDVKDEDILVCASPKGESSPIECSEDFLPKLVSRMERSVFCLFPEHSDSFFEKIAAHTWSVTTQGSRTCSSNHNWWKKMNICPKI